MADSPAQLAKRLERLHSGLLRDDLRRMGIRLAFKAEEQAKLNATDRLRVRSGRLRNSIAGTTADSPTGIQVRLSAGGRTGGRDVRYARIQERGGTIEPLRRQFLTYPVHPSLFTAAGVLRFPSARMVPNLFYDGSGKTPVLRSSITGEVFYVLLRQVVIKPKHYLRDGLRTAAESLPAEFRQTVKEAVHG